MDKQLQALLFEQWTNGACLGYVIKAMENLDYQPKDIQAVVSEMKWLFDMNTLKEADRHYWTVHFDMQLRANLARSVRKD